jgi:arylsulfate sulfotransferase
MMLKHLSKFLSLSFVLALISFVSGCGGGSSTTTGNSISVAVSPATATVTSGGSTQFTATVTGDSANGGVTWSVSGASATPGTIDATGKYTAPTVTAATTATVIATSKTDTTKTGMATVTINPAAATGVTVSPQTAFVGAGQVQQFTATVTGESANTVTWSVNGTAGGNATVGMIDANGNYTAPATATNATAQVTATSTADTTKSANASVSVVANGVVTSTANVQVASYTITAPATANVSIQFGADTTYGLNTWQQPSASGGGAVTILVAGMKMNTAYHMRANVVFADGTKFNDIDHTFTTGTVPAANLPQITVTTPTPGANPQPGVELLDLLGVTGPAMNGVVTDIQGDVIWTLQPTLAAGQFFSPLKLLANGHFLAIIANQAEGINSSMVEYDLAGTVISTFTSTQLSTALAAATCAGCQGHTIGGMHHDYALLPNGHMIVIVSETIPQTGLTGQSGTVNVLGDDLIELDQNHNPVWFWTTFNHPELDLNRHPLGLPDWTHTNTVIYTPDDHNLMISMRNQDWVLKIDYNDGKGTGNILYRLGYQGDFTLINAGATTTDPSLWFYGQHDINVVSQKSSGVFSVTLFDDGNNRVLNNNNDNTSICGTGPAPPCSSASPILELDETAKTATIQFRSQPPVYPDKPQFIEFAAFGGSARLLANNDLEYDLCGLAASGSQALNNMSDILEVAQPSGDIAWRMQLTGNYAYRSFRIPSLYPGVQW